MPGGLLNLVSYGAQNVILNGNPSKLFLSAHMQSILISDYKSFV